MLQEWYDEHWNAAEDVTAEILRVLKRQIHEYSPFEVYARSLQEYFRGHEMSVEEWELGDPNKDGSRLYKKLDKYQQEGYQSLRSCPAWPSRIRRAVDPKGEVAHAASLRRLQSEGPNRRKAAVRVAHAASIAGAVRSPCITGNCE